MIFSSRLSMALPLSRDNFATLLTCVTFRSAKCALSCLKQLFCYSLEIKPGALEFLLRVRSSIGER